MEDDLIRVHQVIKSLNSQKWIDVMNEDFKSMQDNQVWNSVSLPKGSKYIGCKWIFKTKRIQLVMWKDIRLVL